MSNSEDSGQQKEYTEYLDVNLPAYGDLSNEDLSSLNFEGEDEQPFEEHHLQSMYRSIAAVPASSSRSLNVVTSEISFGQSKVISEVSATQEGLHQSKTMKQVSAASQPVEVASSSSQHEGTGKSSKSVPKVPIFLAPSTHFETTLPVDDVTARVEMGLNSELGVSYEFFPSRCRWECVYLVGSSRCKFEVNVYKKPDNASLIVEGNRLSGDSYAFVTMYQSIRNEFDSSRKTVSAPPLLAPPPKRQPDIAAVQSSLASVLAMAESACGEAKLGASQILCSLSSDVAMHPALINSGCVQALSKLTHVEFESCNQHAICALANMSVSPLCQSVLLQDKPLVQFLLTLCTDGGYNTIEMRRESARILENICCSNSVNAQHVVNSAGSEFVQMWLQGVDGLRDSRLKTHADRARVSLASCT